MIPGWARLCLVALPLLAGGGFLLAALTYSVEVPPPVAPDALLRSVSLPPAPGLLVEVSGAVAHPGLYRLQRGDRLYAAIAAAGGIAPGADPNRLPNLAARLRDGQQVKVPFVRSARSTAVRVDLNAADLGQLLQVPGFTPDMAAAAISYRDQYGGFASSLELETVLGMPADAYLLAKPYLRP